MHWSLVALLWTLLTATAPTRGLFLENEAYTYQYKAVVQTSVNKPTHSASSWDLNCDLDVQSNGTEALLQFHDCSTSLHNGNLGDNDEERNHVKNILLPNNSHHLENQFIVHYQQGYVQSISILKDEPLWSINIKRSLASILQMDISKLNQGAAKTVENTLYGRRTVEYIITNDGKNVTVRKFFDYEDVYKVTDFPMKVWSNVPLLSCAPIPQSLISSSERVYSLAKVNAEVHKLLEVNAVGTINLQMFPPNGELQYILVNQSIHIKTTTENPKDWKQEGTLKNVGLKFEISFSDLNQDRNKLKKEYVLKKIDSLMKNLAESLETTPGSLPLDKLHQDNVPQLLYLLYTLDKSDLESYYSELAIGTSYQQETKRNFFLELLPKVGTEASVLFIRDLILNCKVKEDSAVKLLTNFPFHIREPSEHLLQECEVLLSLGDDKSARIKQTAVLSFSNLIYKICPLKCSAAKFDLYVRQFVDLFTRSTTYDEQMLYLEVLNNIEDGNTFYHILPIIKGNVTQLSAEPHHIRFLGVWATMNKAPYHPEMVYGLYWPILANHSEHLEMRVAALTMLIISQPTTGRFLSLYWYMQSEQNTQLKHFFYTTITSLADSQYPCYSYLKPLASLLLQYITLPNNHKWNTGNYIMDYSESEQLFGGLAHLFLVGSEQAHGPNVFYLQLSNYILGRVVSNTAIYLKIEGVEESLKQQLIKMSTNMLSIPRIYELLKELKPSPVPRQRRAVHIEIIAKVHGRVIFCTYINDTTYHQQLEAFNTLQILHQEFHINHQSVDAPLSYQAVLPTDIGTPALFNVDSAALLSFRGNFTKKWGLQLARTNQFDLWYSATVGASLTTFNPINSLWHTTRRSLTYQLHLPVHHWFGLSIKPLKFNLGSIQRAGTTVSIVAHLRRTTSVTGENNEQLLRESCPSCDTIKDISKIHSDSIQDLPLVIPCEIIGSKFLLSLHHCENKNTPNTWMFVRAFQNIKKNYQVFPLTETLIETLHYIGNTFLLSETDSCGIKAELVSLFNETIKLELFGQGHINNPVTMLETHYFRVGSNSNLTFGTAIKFSFSTGENHGTDKIEIRSQVMDTVNNRRDEKVCIDGEILAPAVNAHQLLLTSPSENITGHFKVIFGTHGSVGCSDHDLTLKLNLSGEFLVARNADAWPHSQCAIEKHELKLEWGNQTPLTEACYRSSVSMGILRRYTASFELENVSSQTVAAEQDNHSSLQWIKSFLLKKLDSTVKTVIEVPEGPDSDVTLYINDDDFLIPHLKPHIEPWLINTHFPLHVQLGLKLGWIGSCVITSDLINTMDNATNTILLTENYTLAAAHCYVAPRFAILIKKLPETKTLAARICAWEYCTEIIPTTEGNYEITVNGEAVPTKSGQYYYPDDLELHDLKLTLHENGLIEISSKTTQLWVQYNGHFMAVNIPALYSFQTCGLCGDFNGNSNNDNGEVLSLH
ncbi:uncharacterized protein LOC126471429 [Schistocerca serialis cubense]|uniref:uncharacterized protein LOC126471429 n=1 Tax=Schistocerca serialis cubense TaxID=2023355 RepID=UPI00214ED0BD|nr:uncharacterized protein LOC126471429 [Schistocerca serialis cubense]